MIEGREGPGFVSSYTRGASIQRLVHASRVRITQASTPVVGFSDTGSEMLELERGADKAIMGILSKPRATDYNGGSQP